ncbi:hypothetical protein Pst134EA_033270 [Puccinia striiformis f. sp. tritici]|uniref:hypothetical protein n=1 Tax=Puccinia striiformis f. sp. tritici TaxID=168172 RepID=UPI002007AA0E|nr:hypothetical protein Pst134EA_033270 [Puccinia striiformis f. sp. tritici]KAH9472845.1 hypothetical protein Pst134EA_033270 [Puccinia striiformis f. sp. tritici]KAI9611655.1 hypothetical protein H4Q26_008610 [Puccinia striiformis f. sp. tritici PST-130]
MADQETNSIPQTASVLELLRDLIERHEESMNGPHGEEKQELTQDERDHKIELLDKLHSPLLPAIQDRLCSLLTSLDLQQHVSEKHPHPNFELTCKILSELDETMYETIYAIESAALDTIPIHTQDHHFGRCKDFRTTHLMFSISTLIVSLQCIFLRSSCFIKAWERSTKNPKNAKYRTVTSRAGTIVLGQIVECAHLAGNISKWTQASDFQVIQDEWEKKAELLNPSLEIVMDLTQSRTSRRESITPLREHIIELAQSTATLIKLSRILLTNISKNKPRKLPFTLDTVINSETLSALHERPGGIAYQFERHVKILSESFESDILVGGKAAMRDRIGSLSISFDSILVLLAAYLVALPPGINHASLRTDFKAWLSVWQRSWHTAARHFTNGLDSIQDPN